MILKGRKINNSLLDLHKDFLKVFGVICKVVSSLKIKKEEEFLTKVYGLLSSHFFAEVSCYSNDEDKKIISLYKFFDENKELKRIDRYNFRKRMLNEFEKDPYYIAATIRVEEERKRIKLEIENSLRNSKKRRVFDLSVLEA